GRDPQLQLFGGFVVEAEVGGQRLGEVLASHREDAGEAGRSPVTDDDVGDSCPDVEDGVCAGEGAPGSGGGNETAGEGKGRQIDGGRLKARASAGRHHLVDHVAARTDD